MLWSSIMDQIPYIPVHHHPPNGPRSLLFSVTGKAVWAECVYGLAHSPALRASELGLSFFYHPSMISAPNVHSWQGVTLGGQLVALVRPCPDTLSNSLDTGSGRHLSYHPEPWVSMKSTGMKNLNSWESESQPLCLLNTPTTQRIFWAPPPMHPSGVLPSPSPPPGVSWGRDQALGHSRRVLRFPLGASE